MMFLIDYKGANYEGANDIKGREKQGRHPSVRCVQRRRRKLCERAASQTAFAGRVINTSDNKRYRVDSNGDIRL